ncbi:unnamed protein product [Candida verbasci]|uniref:proline--tRNA ligase n=1 Tax=Candida verbasci TaxID=1227364 RepID=A0A9W4TRA1_9ASCO|nr:unnamed protein product [Candida verbasci]
MIKRVPKFYGNVKINNRLPTYELLSKLNIVSHPSSGFVNWSSIGLLIEHKISNLIRKHLNSIHGEEVKLSLISNKELWERTGRWENTEIFKLDNDKLLVPTSEEQITDHVDKNLKSYKELPILLYQINTKFRNEKRPRGGLLRGKEFLMNDGYSFDIDEKNAMKSYNSIVEAYHKIFTDLRVPYIKANADSGDIGGDLSHEWHYIDKTGEDLVFTCDSCGNISNIEKTLSIGESQYDVDVKYFTTNDRNTLICAYYPKGRILEPKFIKSELELPEDLIETTDLTEFSDISKRVIRIMDSRLTSRSNFPDFPIDFVNRSLITTLTDIPIVLAQEGETCHECEEGKLNSSPAIEVGHTFYLGDKYSKPMNCKIDIPEGNKTKSVNLMMGCYGIGISRIIAAIAEINRDEQGLRWPSIISPWNITIVSKDHYDFIKTLDFDYRLDDRDENFSKKINLSNSLGIPLIVILGRSFPICEIEIRGKLYSQSWKEQYPKLKDKYQWTVNNGKHFVHKDGLTSIVNILLNDM